MFYHYSQNNSGGSFHIDDDVAHHVIIEANSAAEADEKAESIGIYFNGCDNGSDCSCCGDRWSSQWNDDSGSDVPLIYGDDPKMYQDMWTAPGDPICHIYRADGFKETIRQPAKDSTLAIEG